MAYRLACERADALSAIVSLAGLASSNPAGCTPSQPVPVLHMHGTADAVVPYTAGGYGADTSVDQWTAKNGCAGTTRGVGTSLDLDTAVAGTETVPAPIIGCPAGGEVELWKMQGSSHTPTLAGAFMPQLMEWLTVHRRPSR
ncbi:MAG: hypothetical protein SFX73_29795 [Kofleriaceae bacterium]|nr:hypothetical protein [Kofleriaceae bacterium]